MSGQINPYARPGGCVEEEVQHEEGQGHRTVTATVSGAKSLH
jgi:hypothetical protein